MSILSSPFKVKFILKDVVIDIQASPFIPFYESIIHILRLPLAKSRKMDKQMY